MTTQESKPTGPRSGNTKASIPVRRAGIVGAGMAGAACAARLVAAGWEVDVFDKSRGTGGRMSTRRLDDGWASLGTPFISAKRNPFRGQVRDWVRQGLVEPLRGDVWKGRATVTWAQAQMQNHFRPVVEPSQLVRRLLGGANLFMETRAASLRPQTIVLEDGREMGPYTCVISSVPGPQAISMLDALPLLREPLAKVRYRPIWSFLMRWEGGPSANVIKFDDHLLELAVRQPGGDPGLWAVHSSHEFAETYLEASVEEASTRAASALMGLLSLPWPVEVEASHLWRYARPETPLGGYWLCDEERRVSVIGDGIAGVGVERAWESGTKLAEALLQAHG